MRLHPLGELEGPICDAALMAQIAYLFVCESTLNPHDQARDAGQAVPLRACETEQIRFCLAQIERMLTDLKDEFYERFEDGRRL